MEFLILSILSAILFAVLTLLAKLFLHLVSVYVLLSILVVALWVGGNIWLMSWLGKKGEEISQLKRFHTAWESFFYYSALLQGLMFTVFIVWGLAIVFGDAVPPANQAEFILEFVIGSSLLAGVIFFLGIGVGGTYMGELKGLRRVLAFCYSLVALAVAVAPWVFSDWMEGFVQGDSPEALFWGTVVLYALLSSTGMRLMFGAMDRSETKPPGSEPA